MSRSRAEWGCIALSALMSSWCWATDLDVSIVTL
jgi:hypothetical protein